MSCRGADPEVSVSTSMADSSGSGGHELSSSSRTQLSRLGRPDAAVNHSKSQSKDQPTLFTHFTNKFLVSPETNLAIGRNDKILNKPWRPFTLRAPTIIASLIITIALIALIEYINKVSTEEKALFFAERVEDFTMGVVFCYQYLPQMIVVALGVGWAAVDLDVKRLEPYFQLSKPEGATASNSIFLHYPFDFIAFVPINAARKGSVLLHMHSVRNIHN